MRFTPAPVLIALGLALLACRPEPPPAPPPAGGYQAGAVAEAGSIEGRVRYEGSEEDRRIVVGRDPDACGALGSELLEGSLLRSETGGLANVVVMVEGLRRGKPLKAADRSLVNAGCLFEPRVLVASVGDRLVVGSRDPALHSTRVRIEGRTLFNLTLPESGSQIVKPLKEAGLLQVGCDAHDWMRAWIWVGESPYLSLTGPEGEFVLEGLPPGDHELRFWHERLGEKRVQVRVPPEGRERVDLSF